MSLRANVDSLARNPDVPADERARVLEDVRANIQLGDDRITMDSLTAVQRTEQGEPGRVSGHGSVELRPGRGAAYGVDLSKILYQPEVGPDVAKRAIRPQDHGLAKALDNTLIAQAAPALERREAVEIRLPIRNLHRTVGTMLGAEVTRRYGGDGLPEDTIRNTGA